VRELFRRTDGDKVYYALISYDGERWSAHGCDDFEWRDEEPGKDGPALDRLKQRTFHKIQELNDGHTIIVKWLYTNIAYRHYKKLLNEHAEKQEGKADSASKLLEDAGVET
jgi:hypothetical protein